MTRIIVLLVGVLIATGLVPATAQTAMQGQQLRGHAWLGVRVQSLTSDLADAFGVNGSAGAAVVSIEPNGPAALAKIEVGDVITAVDDQSVKGAPDLRQKIVSMEPGTSVSLTIIRNGGPKTLVVKLGAAACTFPLAMLAGPDNRSAIQKMASDAAEHKFWQSAVPDDSTPDDAIIAEFLYDLSTHVPSGTYIGGRPDYRATLQLALKQLWEVFYSNVPPHGFLGVQLRESRLGPVVVAKPEAGTPAAKAGIQSNDVIIAFNNELIPSLDQFLIKMSAIKAGTVVELSVYSGPLGEGPSSRPVSLSEALKQRRTISVTLGERDMRKEIRDQVLACFSAVAQTLQRAADTRAKIENAERARKQQIQESFQRQKNAARHQQEEREAQEAEAMRQKAEQAKRARARGYEPISVETFVLDGKGLAARKAKVSLHGVYVREGNIDILYADNRAVMMAMNGVSQPKVPLLVDDAPRQFRKILLACQTDMRSARWGCVVTVLGHVTLCRFTNAFGTGNEMPCVAADDGRGN